MHYVTLGLDYTSSTLCVIVTIMCVDFRWPRGRMLELWKRILFRFYSTRLNWIHYSLHNGNNFILITSDCFRDADMVIPMLLWLHIHQTELELTTSDVQHDHPCGTVDLVWPWPGRNQITDNIHELTWPTHYFCNFKMVMTSGSQTQYLTLERYLHGHLCAGIYMYLT